MYKEIEEVSKGLKEVEDLLKLIRTLRYSMVDLVVLRYSTRSNDFGTNRLFLEPSSLTSSYTLIHCHILFIDDVVSRQDHQLYLSGKRRRVLQSSNSCPTTTNIGRDCWEFASGGKCENQQSGLLHGDLKPVEAEVN